MLHAIASLLAGLIVAVLILGIIQTIVGCEDTESNTRKENDSENDGSKDILEKQKKESQNREKEKVSHAMSYSKSKQNNLNSNNQDSKIQIYERYFLERGYTEELAQSLAEECYFDNTNNKRENVSTKDDVLLSEHSNSCEKKNKDTNLNSDHVLSDAENTGLKSNPKILSNIRLNTEETKELCSLTTTLKSFTADLEHYNKEVINDKKVETMEGHDFEYYCAQLLRRNGYANVKVTPKSGDMGTDILAVKDDCQYAIQCKRWKKNINNSVVSDVNTGKEMYDCDKAIVLTNSQFTREAYQLANKLKVSLWDKNMLYQLQRNRFRTIIHKFNPNGPLIFVTRQGFKRKSHYWKCLGEPITEHILSEYQKEIGFCQKTIASDFLWCFHDLHAHLYYFCFIPIEETDEDALEQMCAGNFDIYLAEGQVFL